jgi:hypothetical protein
MLARMRVARCAWQFLQQNDTGKSPTPVCVCVCHRLSQAAAAAVEAKLRETAFLMGAPAELQQALNFRSRDRVFADLPTVQLEDTVAAVRSRVPVTRMQVCRQLVYDILRPHSRRCPARSTHPHSRPTPSLSLSLSLSLPLKYIRTRTLTRTSTSTSTQTKNLTRSLPLCIPTFLMCTSLCRLRYL